MEVSLKSYLLDHFTYACLIYVLQERKKVIKGMKDQVDKIARDRWGSMVRLYVSVFRLIHFYHTINLLV